jgi:Phage tail tube protein
MAPPVTAKFGKMRVLLGEASGTDPAAVPVTNLSNTNPAVVTVGAADIAKFQNGATVTIAGATGDMAAANGSHRISSVGSPVNTFTLADIDLSAGAAPVTTGVTADAPALMVYGAPCGLTTKNLTLSKNLQEVNIPDCEDPDAPVWLGRDVQNLSATISGDGVAAAESVPDWNDAAISTESIPMRVEIEFSTGLKSFEGYFIIDNLAFNAEQGGRVSLSFNAQSDGEITDMWTPV